jgi:hypothetical protein
MLVKPRPAPVHQGRPAGRRRRRAGPAPGQRLRRRPGRGPALLEAGSGARSGRRSPSWTPSRSRPPRSARPTAVGCAVVLGGLVGLLSVMLLGTQGGPPFTGDTSRFQFFGYFGLFCATVLILRVIVAILRDGLS